MARKVDEAFSNIETVVGCELQRSFLCFRLSSPTLGTLQAVGTVSRSLENVGVMVSSLQAVAKARNSIEVQSRNSRLVSLGMLTVWFPGVRMEGRRPFDTT